MIKKVILIAHNNDGSRELFTSIHESHKDVEFALIITEGLYYKKTFFQSMVKMLREASFVFCFQRLLDLLMYRLRGDTLISQAKKRGVKMFFTNDVNGEASHNFIKEFAPDLIISTFTMHIIKRPTMELSRVASIGCHPSILPHYRGLEVFFWALANNEKSSGVSVFYLTEKIDAGKVIMQEEFVIAEDETLVSIYAKLTRVTAKLLIETIKKFKKDEPFSIIDSSGDGQYYPMPTREAYRKFTRLGKKWR